MSALMVNKNMNIIGNKTNVIVISVNLIDAPSMQALTSCQQQTHSFLISKDFLNGNTDMDVRILVCISALHHHCPQM